jgi:hypothetical protein
MRGVDKSTGKTLAKLFSELLEVIDDPKVPDGMKRMTIIYRDSDNALKQIIEGIQDLGNCGHSFSIVLDPDNPSESIKCGWDGDGNCYIDKITIDPVEED